MKLIFILYITFLLTLSLASAVVNIGSDNQNIPKVSYTSTSPTTNYSTINTNYSEDSNNLDGLDSSTFVPYSGASGNVNMSDNNITDINTLVIRDIILTDISTITSALQLISLGPSNADGLASMVFSQNHVSLSGNTSLEFYAPRSGHGVNMFYNLYNNLKYPKSSFIIDLTNTKNKTMTIDGGLNVTNNITAQTYFGDGSQLTGVSTSNRFDQELNTTNNVIFRNITVEQNIKLYNDSTKAYIMGMSKVLQIENEENTSASATGKNRFQATYAPSASHGSTTGNYFDAYFSPTGLPTTATYILNKFNAQYKSHATSPYPTTNNVVGTYFNNTLEGQFSSGGFSAWSLIGVLYDVKYLGQFTGIGAGLTPVKIAVEMNASVGASHSIQGLYVETILNAKDDNPNTVTSFAGKTTINEAQTIGTRLGVYSAELSIGDKALNITKDVSMYYASPKDEDAFNTSIAVGKSYNVFFVDAELFNMPNRTFNSFYTNAPKDKNNFAFHSRYAKSLFQETYINQTLNATDNVYIYGNLSVQKYMILKANTTAMLCTGANEGAIYYDNVTGSHMGCNGVSWNALY